MKLNTIQREGQWSNIADSLNENFSKVDNAVEALNAATIKNIGYFATVDALREAYPIASAGAKAYVGSDYPYAIYLWDVATSTWVDSSETGGEESVNLGDYYTKEETDEKVTELELVIGEYNKTLTAKPNMSVEVLLQPTNKIQFLVLTAASSFTYLYVRKEGESNYTIYNGYQQFATGVSHKVSFDYNVTGIWVFFPSTTSANTATISVDSGLKMQIQSVDSGLKSVKDVVIMAPDVIPSSIEEGGIRLRYHIEREDVATDLTIKLLSEDYQVAVDFYDVNNSIYRSLSWANELFVPNESYSKIRLNFKRVDGAAFTFDEIKDYIVFGGYVVSNLGVSNNQSYKSELDLHRQADSTRYLSYYLYDYNNVSDLLFVGEESLNRVFKNFYIVKDSKFTLNINTIGKPWNVAFTAFDKDGNKLVDSGWQTNIIYKEQIINNAVNLRLAFAYMTGDYMYKEQDLNDAILSFNLKAVKDVDLEEKMSQNAYYGSPVRLNIFKQKQYGYTKEELLSVIYDNTKLIERYNQSIAVADNRIFAFADSGFFDITNGENNVIVYDATTMQEVGRGCTGIADSHHNNAQFLKSIKYDINDKYPLLVLSRGDYPGASADYKQFYIMRVIENDGVFIFERLKTITCNVVNVSYNGSWIYDEVNEVVYMYTHTIGNYQIRDGNNTCIIGFPLSIAEIKNTSDLTLNNEDVISRIVLPYGVWQSGECYNGRLYMPTQYMTEFNGTKQPFSGNNRLLVINPNDGNIDSLVPITEGIEPEGISIYDNKMYISYHNGAPNIGDVCLLIEGYTFDL